MTYIVPGSKPTGDKQSVAVEFDFFPVGPVHGGYEGEDHGFCRRWREIGGRLCGTNPVEYVTAFQQHARSVSQNPEQWLPWNFPSPFDIL